MEFVTAGESHGPALTAIVTGVPAGIYIDIDEINADLARRQSGYGRGGRQKIESDTAQILSGVRFCRTIGSPIALQVANDDFANWTDRMAPLGDKPEGLVRETHPRPGHADLCGMLKIGSDDARDILERTSARETAARVAAAGVAKAFLTHMGVRVASFVKRIGPAAMDDALLQKLLALEDIDVASIEQSSCRCPDAKVTAEMERAIDAAAEKGVSLGGEFVVVADGLVCGLGSYTSGPSRLTSRLGAALFAVPAIKGVEFGMGFEAARKSGDEVHDPIVFEEGSGYCRASNNAGGLEGGMTNGERLYAACAMKPIPTMRSALATVDTDTHEVVEASKERSDVCAVAAAAVVAEAEVSFVLAQAYLDKFGGDCIDDILAARDAYLERIGCR